MSEAPIGAVASTGPAVDIRICLAGRGLLADTVETVLAASATIHRVDLAEARAMPRDTTALVVANDAWSTEGYAAAREACRQDGVAWLPVRAELGRIVIGPVEMPGEVGCTSCADFRRRRAAADPHGHDAVLNSHGGALASRPSAWLTGLGADLAARLVADEIPAITRDPNHARTRNAVVCVDLSDLGIAVHNFIPDPLCPACGRLPEDSAAQARLPLRSRLKRTRDTYRVREPRELDRLESLYVSHETGVVREISKGHEGGLAVSAAVMRLRDDAREAGFGRTRSYGHSRRVALLEALERYGGVEPSGKKTVVEASHAELGDCALNPADLGLYPDDRYRLPGFPYAPFDSRRPIRWVWGYSFKRNSPLLVPEAYAYYRTHRKPRVPPPLVYEISNGCALGGCLEEAILHGILEVAERDAFLMTWYARLAVPRIDLGSATDRTIPLIAESIRSETGYEVSAFNTTMEHGVPCVWAMAVDTGTDRLRPKVACAAGSHLRPERAVENSLSELGSVLADLLRRYPEERDRARAMAVDPSLVETMHDHSTLYGNPEVFDRFDFLTQGRAGQPISEMLNPDAFGSTDLLTDLNELVDRYIRCGMDVIVVDQTTLEHRRGELTCVKVIIPGALPMTFGHDYRRVDGLPRLHSIPWKLGYSSRPLEPEDLNLHPHPFP